MSELRKNQTLEIDPADPWANDPLERKKVAEYLTPMLASVQQPFVIGLTAPFGTGKTQFIKCWRHDLALQGFRAIYFNVWETDFSQDPLFAFMASIKRQLDEMGAKDTEQRFGELAKRAGGLIRSKALPILLRGLARKALDDETAKEVLDVIGASEEDISSFVGAMAEEQLRAQEAAEEALARFREYLGETVTALTEKEQDPARRKIIIFVDELDRCRPTYAIEVLECVKHLFSVEGLVFVLALDDEQLRNTIASVYGAGFDGDGYLRRFIDWKFKLPNPSTHAFSAFLSGRFALAEMDKLGGQDGFDDLNKLLSGFAIFAEGFGLSLRQQEQAFTEINLVLRALREGTSPLANVLGCLSALRTVQPGLIEAVCKREQSQEQILDLVERHIEGIASGDFYGDWADFRPIFHSWFLTEEDNRKLRLDRSDLEAEINTLSSAGKQSEELDLIQKKYQYLGSVTDMFRYGFRHVGILDGSLAWMVYQRLEGAAAYT
ncbi:MAG: hypothetical protein IH905_09425 [Proteobacteria bacterium]|nr:hypothetical protein [Pseudomonadota bacterium]